MIAWKPCRVAGETLFLSAERAPSGVVRLNLCPGALEYLVTALNEARPLSGRSGVGAACELPSELAAILGACLTTPTEEQSDDEPL